MLDIIALLNSPISIAFFLCLFAAFLIAFIFGWIWRGVSFSSKRGDNAQLRDANRKIEVLQEDFITEELEYVNQIRKIKKESSALLEVNKISDKEYAEMKQQKETLVEKIKEKIEKNKRKAVSRAVDVPLETSPLKKKQQALNQKIADLNIEVAMMRLEDVPDDAPVDFIKYGSGNNIDREMLLLARRTMKQPGFIDRNSAILQSKTSNKPKDQKNSDSQQDINATPAIGQVDIANVLNDIQVKIPEELL